MVEQVANRDGLAVRGEVWKEVGEAVVVTQLGIARQQHDARCGELLGE